MTGRRASGRSRIDIGGSPFFQLLVLANVTAKPFGERFGRQLGLGLSEWRAMMVIADRPGLTAQDLAELTGLDKMSVSRAVRGLEAKRRIVREAKAGDRRSFRLYLTRAGWRVYDEVALSGRERERDIFAHLSPRDRARFFALLQRLNAAARLTDQKP